MITRSIFVVPQEPDDKDQKKVVSVNVNVIIAFYAISTFRRENPTKEEHIPGPSNKLAIRREMKGRVCPEN